MQAFCASSLGDPTEDVRRKTVEVIRSVQDAMFLLTNLSSKTESYKPCAPSYPAWFSEADAIAKHMVANVTPACNGVCDKPLSWEDRRGIHETVAKGIVLKLNASTYSDG